MIWEFSWFIKLNGYLKKKCTYLNYFKFLEIKSNKKLLKIIEFYNLTLFIYLKRMFCVLLSLITKHLKNIIYINWLKIINNKIWDSKIFSRNLFNPLHYRLTLHHQPSNAAPALEALQCFVFSKKTFTKHSQKFLRRGLAQMRGLAWEDRLGGEALWKLKFDN